MTAPGSDESTFRRWGGFALGVAISALFVYLTLRQIPLGTLVREISKVHLGILSLTLGTKFLGFVVMTVRSQVLFAPLDRFRFWRMFKSILVAFVGNNVLPFRAGELARIGYLAREREDVPASSAFAAVALERLLDLFTLALLFLILLSFALIDFSSEGVPQGAVVYLTTGILTVAVIGALGVSYKPDLFVGVIEPVASLFGDRFSGFVTDRARHFAEGLSGLSSPGQAASVVVLSFAYWGTAIASIAVWIWAFRLSLPWHAPLVIAVFSAFATVLPSSPGFVGTYHYFVKTAVEFFGVSAAVSASFAIVGHAAAMLPFTLVGILILLRDYLEGELVMPDRGLAEAENRSGP